MGGTFDSLVTQMTLIYITFLVCTNLSYMNFCNLNYILLICKIFFT